MNRALLGVVALGGLAFGVGLWLAREGGFLDSGAIDPETLALLQPEAPVGATLLEGLGDVKFKISTDQEEAQQWFAQGMSLTYGFNHDAAERSFLKATEIDPRCAMCWWGAALVLGPHVNAPMDPMNNAKAWKRLQKAQVAAQFATATEQAYIVALSARYAAEPEQDREQLDQAYADAMGELSAALPQDLHAATLYAEALMNLQPWYFYDGKGEPRGRTAEFVAILESVIQRDPYHAGALHLYIHAVEASANPARGVAAADRLRDLVPGSGHLVHMPAHIYTRVGRYQDAVLANQKAIEADDQYLAVCKPAPGIYPLGYVPHNHHYLWWAASMQGSGELAIQAADETARRANLPELIHVPELIFLQDFLSTPLKARVQFARWKEILEIPEPEETLVYPRAMWHFARGMAELAQGKISNAASHHAALDEIAADPAWESAMIGPRHSLASPLNIAERILAAGLAEAQGQTDQAIAILEQGVEIEDKQAYYEPPVWHQPVRHYLGALLLRHGLAGEAELRYRQDLQKNSENGWSLFGLVQALRTQGRNDEARQAEIRFAKAWEHADIELGGSRL